MSSLDRRKVCARCREQKPLGAFHRDKNGTYGRFNYCKDCWREYRKTNVNQHHLTRARREAIAVLIDRHQEEFNRLYTFAKTNQPWSDE